MTDTKRRQNIQKKRKRREQYCESVPGRIVADHDGYKRDIGMSDGGFIDYPNVRRDLKQKAHKVVRKDGRQVIVDQLDEASEETRMEKGMRRFLKRNAQ